MNRAKRIHTEIITKLAMLLRSKNACRHLEYTGSSYEGVKVSKSSEDHDLEFDIMVILEGGGKLRAEPLEGTPCYAQLKIPNSAQEDPLFKNVASYSGIVGFLTEAEWVLSPEKSAQRFFGMLQKCIDSIETTRGKIKLRQHGPAVQMDVYPDSGVFLWGEKLYSVDMVPTYRVNGQLYVAKPLEKDKDDVGNNAWRESFSLEEKAKLYSSDRGNECRKRVLRVLKVIRNGEAGLKSLTSYHLKTALFWVMDNRTISWSNEFIGARLMDVFVELEKSLSAGCMPHYFVHTVNILSHLSTSNMNNMRDRIKRFIYSKETLMKVLKS